MARKNAAGTASSAAPTHTPPRRASAPIARHQIPRIPGMVVPSHQAAPWPRGRYWAPFAVEHVVPNRHRAPGSPGPDEGGGQRTHQNDANGGEQERCHESHRRAHTRGQRRSRSKAERDDQDVAEEHQRADAGDPAHRGEHAAQSFTSAEHPLGSARRPPCVGLARLASHKHVPCPEQNALARTHNLPDGEATFSGILTCAGGHGE